MITVLVVDDHPIVRDGVSAALARSELRVVAEAATAGEAVRLAVEHRPTVVLMDLSLPDFSGIESTRQILEKVPDTAVVAFTMSDDDASVFAALRAGAMGYLVKGVGKEELVRGIEAVAGGEVLLLGQGVAKRVQAHFAGLPGSNTAVDADDGVLDAAGLTPRERDVLGLMAEGWGNQTIAARLFLSPKTVRNHVSTIIGKLQATDRGEAVVRARKLGFGTARA
ncbi:response regulator [Homoserinimonas sp. A520]